MRSHAQVAVIVLSGLGVASLTACGDDTAGGGGSGGATSSSSDASSPSSSAASTPATTGSSSASSASSASTGGGEGGEGGQLAAGDCFDNDDCEPTQFCAFTWGRAVCESQEGEPGDCVDRPTDCPENYDPVCGCDGEIYGNGCAANAAGVDIGPGGCPALEGYAKCDYRYCAEPAVCADGGDVDYRQPYCFRLPDECTGPTCGGAGEGGGGAGVGGGGAGGSDACGDALSTLCDQAGNTNGVVTECSEDASGLRIACDTDV